MQLSEAPKLGFTGVVNAKLLIHGRQKCPKYWIVIVGNLCSNPTLLETARYGGIDPKFTTAP